MEPDFSKFIKVEDDNFKLPEELPELTRDIYFFDVDGKICDKDHAVKFVATTYDKDGNRVNETWGSCSPKIQRDDKGEYLKSK
jgi:hypothetical protein